MSLFRPTLDALEGYVPSPSKPGLRLHLNESARDLPVEFKQEVAARVAALDWSRYPEATNELRKELARQDGWVPEGVLVGNGSNEFLQVLTITTLAPGDTVVIAKPSFSVYATQAQAAGANIVEVPLRNKPDAPFAFDIDAFIEAANAHAAKLVVVISPNNPTGSVVTEADLRKLHDSTQALIAVDEAYRHFTEQEFVPLLRDCERLILMRTFSKSYAAAAIRLGWVLAAPEVCDTISKVLMPYNLSAVSCEIARALVARPDLVEKRIREVVEERARLASELATIPGLRVEAEGANFVLVEHPTLLGRDIAKGLEARGILIRDLGGYPGCERCVRISIGAREANDAVVRALREVA